MTTNDGCRGDVRKARAEAAEVKTRLTTDERALLTDAFKGASRAAEHLAFLAAPAVERILADRLATDTAAPEGRLDEEYAENLIGFVRTFETGEHAANALPIFLRTHQKAKAARAAAAPVAVEGVETVEWRSVVKSPGGCVSHHRHASQAEAEHFRDWRTAAGRGERNDGMIWPPVEITLYSRRVSEWSPVEPETSEPEGGESR